MSAAANAAGYRFMKGERIPYDPHEDQPARRPAVMPPPVRELRPGARQVLVRYRKGRLG